MEPLSVAIEEVRLHRITVEFIDEDGAKARLLQAERQPATPGKQVDRWQLRIRHAVTVVAACDKVQDLSCSAQRTLDPCVTRPSAIETAIAAAPLRSALLRQISPRQTLFQKGASMIGFFNPVMVSTKYAASYRRLRTLGPHWGSVEWPGSTL